MASVRLLKVYKYGQIPTAFLFGYLIREESLDCKQPEFISNVAGVTCGILGSYVWPAVPFVYGYKHFNDSKDIYFTKFT